MNEPITPQSAAKKDRVAIYYRVSTNKQTTECQKPDVSSLLSQRGLVAAITYEEQASAMKRRPAFDKMLAEAGADFDILVIWSLDRFGRSMGGNIRDLLKLDNAGVRVISVKEPWLDTAGPVRELLVAIFSWVAQQERDRLIERTKAGIAASRARGKTWGRRSPGLLPASLRTAVVDQWEAEGKQDGFAGLAALLGCKSPTTAWKIYGQMRPPAGIVVT